MEPPAAVAWDIQTVASWARAIDGIAQEVAVKIS
jgi:hypothetical protein